MRIFLINLYMQNEEKPCLPSQINIIQAVARRLIVYYYGSHQNMPILEVIGG